MGTRSLIAVMIDGEYKIAQYSQWDGYPEGQGKIVLSFLRSMKKRDFVDFVEKLKATQWITEEELSARWKEFGADDSDYVSCEIADKFKEKYPELSRDTGGKILEIVAKSDAGIKLQNSIDFAGNSLFCEWAYVIDFDKNTFEVYRGFNKNPLKKTERFVNAPKNNDASEYWPIKMVKKYSLDKLPTVATFLKEMNKIFKRMNKDE